jgi:hypothetical protein
MVVVCQVRRVLTGLRFLETAFIADILSLTTKPRLPRSTWGASCRKYCLSKAEPGVKHVEKTDRYNNDNALESDELTLYCIQMSGPAFT